MIFKLAQDFHDAVAAMPMEHPKRRMLELLEEAIRRDIHFIDRHPTTLFQCMWNTCWWYDCPEAVKYYQEPEGGSTDRLPSETDGMKLSELLAAWRTTKEGNTPRFLWIRAIRPPLAHLGKTALANVLSGHDNVVNAIAYSPNGQRIASVSDDTTVRIWRAEDGMEIGQYRGDRQTVTAVTFNCHGDRIVTGANDGTVRMWTTDEGTEACVFKGHNGHISQVVSLPGKLWIITCGADGTVRIWNSVCGDAIKCFRHHNSLTCVCCSPDGLHIAAGSTDGGIWTCDVDQSGTVMTHMDGGGHGWGILCICYSADGCFLATGGRDDEANRGEGSLCIYNIQTGQRHSCVGHRAAVTSLAFSPDGLTLASGSQDSTVRLWDVETGKELGCLCGHEGAVRSIAYSPNGRYVASSGREGNILIWDTHIASRCPELHGHKEKIRSVQVSPDGATIVTSSDDGTVRLWEASTGLERCSHRSLGTRVTSQAQFLCDGRRVVFIEGQWHRTMRVWEVESNTLLSLSEGSAWTYALSPHSNDVVIAEGMNGTATIWDTDTGKQSHCLRGHEGPVHVVTYSPDGSQVATGSEDKTVRIWNSGTGTELRCYRRHKDAIFKVEYSPDGSRIASWARDKSVSVWESNTGEEVLRCTEIAYGLWSRDGIRFIGSCVDGTTREWDVETGECVAIGEDPTKSLVARERLRRWPFVLSIIPEIHVRAAVMGGLVAWLNGRVCFVSARPEERFWAIAGHYNLQIIRLEGGVNR